MDVPGKTFSVGLNIQQPRVKGTVVFGGPAINVLIGPFTKPLNASRVVHVIRDVHQPAVRGAFVQVEIILVADVIVPMAKQDFACCGFEVGVDIEDGLQRTGQFVHRSVVEYINEFGQAAVVVLQVVGFQFINALVGPAGGELVGVGVAADESQVGGISAFPKVAMGMVKSLFQPLAIDVFGVGVQPVVATVDEELYVRASRNRNTSIAQALPSKSGTHRTRVVVLTVEVHFLQALPRLVFVECVE